MKYSNINGSPGYLAGVLDSDGSLSVCKTQRTRKNPNYRVHIQISWNYSKAAESYFDFLKRNFGGSYFVGNHHVNGALTIKYSATGKASERILLYVRRDLVLKSKQAKVCLKCLDTVKKVKGQRTVQLSSTLEKLYQANLKLNKERAKYYV